MASRPADGAVPPEWHTAASVFNPVAPGEEYLNAPPRWADDFFAWALAWGVDALRMTARDIRAYELDLCLRGLKRSTARRRAELVGSLLGAAL